jgi:hypothetical protein
MYYISHICVSDYWGCQHNAYPFDSQWQSWRSSFAAATDVATHLSVGQAVVDSTYPTTIFNAGATFNPGDATITMASPSDSNSYGGSLVYNQTKAKFVGKVSSFPQGSTTLTLATYWSQTCYSAGNSGDALQIYPYGRTSFSIAPAGLSTFWRWKDWTNNTIGAALVPPVTNIRLCFYEGAWSLDYTSDTADGVNLRELTKTIYLNNLGTYTTFTLNQKALMGGEFPSMFQFSGSQNAWSQLDPSAYTPYPSPCYTAMVTYSNS